MRLEIEEKRHRAKYGWARSDVWDMDMYLGRIVPEMLRELAANCSAYPGNGEFPTMESYVGYLNGLALVFEIARVDRYSKEYEEAQSRLQGLHSEIGVVERLYARAKAADNLVEFAYAELGVAAAKGLLWD